MPTITFTKHKKNIIVDVGANLMEVIMSQNIPIASSCGGDGVCAKCKVEITSGSQNLSKETERELFLKDINGISSNNRISCQTQVFGDVTIDTPYW